MLEIGTKVRITTEQDYGLTGVITAITGEQCHYQPCKEDLTLYVTDYEVKIDDMEQTLDKDGYYSNYILLDEDEIEVIE